MSVYATARTMTFTDQIKEKFVKDLKKRKVISVSDIDTLWVKAEDEIYPNVLESDQQLKKVNMSKLRTLCENRGLSTSGKTKDELKNRLNRYFKGELESNDKVKKKGTLGFMLGKKSTVLEKAKAGDIYIAYLTKNENYAITVNDNGVNHEMVVLNERVIGLEDKSGVIHPLNQFYIDMCKRLKLDYDISDFSLSVQPLDDDDDGLIV